MKIAVKFSESNQSFKPNFDENDQSFNPKFSDDDGLLNNVLLRIGSLDELSTDDKSSIVGAINELVEKTVATLRTATIE